MTPAQLQQWRERLGLTVDAAARELGLSRRMYIYYEQGGYRIPHVVELACQAIETKMINGDTQ